ncbi:MAG: BLUF domain-containing protein [Phycisphaerales bacterium JB054]
MRRVVYKSVRAAGLTDAQIVDDIVLPTLRRNQENDITGCLWFGPDRFVQVLEGPDEAVDRTFASILADARHRDIQTLEAGPLEVREHADFRMKLIRGDDSDGVAELLSRYPTIGAGEHLRGLRGDGLIAGLRRMMRQMPASRA